VKSQDPQVENLCYGGPARGCPCPGAGVCFLRAARMAQRRKHRASEALEGRSERPATGMGSPEREVAQKGAQVTTESIQ